MIESWINECFPNQTPSFRKITWSWRESRLTTEEAAEQAKAVRDSLKRGPSRSRHNSVGGFWEESWETVEAPEEIVVLRRGREKLFLCPIAIKHMFLRDVSSTP